MSKRSKRRNLEVHASEKPHRNEIEAGMRQVQKLADATRKGYEKGYAEGFEKGRQEGSDFAAYAMCPAIALALHELYKFGKARACRVLNLAGEKMLNAFTTKELIDEAYEKMGFEFADDPLTGHLVEETE